MNEEVKKLAKLIATKYGTSREEVQDIEGRCLEAAWVAEPILRKDVSPIPYFQKTFSHLAISYLRLQKREYRLPKYFDIAYNNMIDDLELKDQFTFLISNLESPDREIVSMLAEGYDYFDIAEELGKTPGAIRTRVSRNKEKWEEIFRSYEKADSNRQSNSG
jgi:DNA-directed RNA polymerase specialized sigma24 family protein